MPDESLPNLLNSNMARMVEKIRGTPRATPERLQANLKDLLRDISPAYSIFTGPGLYGQTKEQIAEQYGGLGVSGALTYHASPYRFAPTKKNPLGEFDLRKIGTGEGAQAYGHGIYLAESQGVGKGYFKNLSGVDFKYSEPSAQAAMKSATNFDDHVWATLGEMAKRHPNDQKALATALRSHAEKYPSGRDAINTAAKLIESGKMKPELTGSLYKVDLPDEHISKMLDWDKPLSQQPEIAKLLQTAPEFKGRIDPTDSLITGQHILAELAAKKGGPEKASAYLRSLGIPGIKYLDQGSRGKVTADDVRGLRDIWRKLEMQQAPPDHIQQAFVDYRKALEASKKDPSTRNFVIFDADLAKIIGKE